VETCRSATLPTTNPTRTGLESNLGSRGERPADDLSRDLELHHILISRFEEMFVSSVPVLPGLPVGQSTCCRLPSGADNTMRKIGIHFDIKRPSASKNLRNASHNSIQ